MTKYSEFGKDFNYSYSAPKNEDEARKRLLAILTKPKESKKKDALLILPKAEVKAVSIDKNFILPKKGKIKTEFKTPKVKKQKKEPKKKSVKTGSSKLKSVKTVVTTGIPKKKSST